MVGQAELVETGVSHGQGAELGVAGELELGRQLGKATGGEPRAARGKLEQAGGLLRCGKGGRLARE